MQRSPPINFPKKNCAPFVIKDLENGILILIGGTLCPCSTRKSCRDICSLYICKEGQTKLVNIFNLAKRILWQNRSVECGQLKPLRAFHWDVTSSWSSFLFLILNSNKTIKNWMEITSAYTYITELMHNKEA